MRTHRQSRGSIFIMTLAILGAVFLFGVAFVGLLRADKGMAQRGELTIIAEGAANAGIERAIWQLKRDSAWSAGFSAVQLPSSKASYTVTFNKTQTAIPWSTNNLAGSASVTGYKGRVVPAGAAHLVSLGTHGTLSFMEEAIVTGSANRFGMAIIGSDEITLNNNVKTDSYDSSLGTYDQTKSNTYGNIGTNSTDNGAISLKTGVKVNTVVTVGPNGTSSVVTGNGTYGSLNVPTSPFPFDPLTAPTPTQNFGNVTLSGSSTLAPGGYGTVTIGNNSTLYLNKGDYVVTSIVATGQGTATIVVNSGPVNIYFSNKVDFGQSTQLNVGGKPSDLTFWGTATAQKFNLGEGTIGYFLLYAPTAEITIAQDSEIYGSFSGKELNIKQGVEIHFDRSLLTQGGGQGAVNIISRW